MTHRRPYIFVADDDELDTSLTTRAIRRALPDAEINVAHDGEAALKELTSIAESGRWPDLILLDYKMPKKGCMDIMTELFRPDLVTKVPFVLFSSSVSPTDVQSVMAEGIREYIEKPTDPDQYDLVIRDVCHRFADKTYVA